MPSPRRHTPHRNADCSRAHFSACSKTRRQLETFYRFNKKGNPTKDVSKMCQVDHMQQCLGAFETNSVLTTCRQGTPRRGMGNAVGHCSLSSTSYLQQNDLKSWYQDGFMETTSVTETRRCVLVQSKRTSKNLQTMRASVKELGSAYRQEPR